MVRQRPTSWTERERETERLRQKKEKPPTYLFFPKCLKQLDKAEARIQELYTGLLCEYWDSAELPRCTVAESWNGD